MPCPRFVALLALCALAASCAVEAVYIGDADAGRGTPRDDAGDATDASTDSGRIPTDTGRTDDATPSDAGRADAADASGDAANDATGDDAADSGTCFIDCDTIDARMCDDEGRVLICADSDRDGCYAWEGPRACADGAVCRGGECVDDVTCDDECTMRGAFACVTGDARAECGDFDDDPCLDLGGPVACDPGEACTDGVCATACEDVCAPGETRCDGEGTVLTCGDYDADPCREFGDPTDCGADQICTAGACVDVAEECLLFGEYVEGASFDKAVEVLNCGGAPRDLRTVGLCLFSNDDSSTCSFTQQLSGTLGAGDVLVLCNGRASIAGCDDASGPVNFNGDDRLVLFQERGGGAGFQAGTDLVLDAFGQSTVRPDGTPWADVTYRRCNPAAYDGRSPFVVTDWYTAHGAGDTSDLGRAPTLAGCP